jgi:hypothetical protein
MEKRISKRVDEYFSSLKQDIKQKFIDNHLHETENGKNILQFILDKPSITFLPEDFVKRQRAKNVVNITDRCNAKRANGELCSRKKRKNSIFCGTHSKGTPYGIIDHDADSSHSSLTNEPTTQKINVHTIEIQGIIYYVDDDNNAYKMEDVLNDKENPTIIGKIPMP